MKNAAHDSKTIWHCIQVWFCFGSTGISLPSSCLWAPFIMLFSLIRSKFNHSKWADRDALIWFWYLSKFSSHNKGERGEIGKPWPFDLHPIAGCAASEVAWVIKTLQPWRLAWVQMREQGYRRRLCCQEHPAKRLPGLWGLYPSLHEHEESIDWPLTSNSDFTCKLM